MRGFPDGEYVCEFSAKEHIILMSSCQLNCCEQDLAYIDTKQAYVFRAWDLNCSRRHTFTQANSYVCNSSSVQKRVCRITNTSVDTTGCLSCGQLLGAVSQGALSFYLPLVRKDLTSRRASAKTPCCTTLAFLRQSVRVNTSRLKTLVVACQPLLQEPCACCMVLGFHSEREFDSLT